MVTGGFGWLFRSAQPALFRLPRITITPSLKHLPYRELSQLFAKLPPLEIRTQVVGTYPEGIFKLQVRHRWICRAKLCERGTWLESAALCLCVCVCVMRARTRSSGEKPSLELCFEKAHPKPQSSPFLLPHLSGADVKLLSLWAKKCASHQVCGKHRRCRHPLGANETVPSNQLELTLQKAKGRQLGQQGWMCLADHRKQHNRCVRGVCAGNLLPFLQFASTGKRRTRSRRMFHASIERRKCTERAAFGLWVAQAASVPHNWHRFATGVNRHTAPFNFGSCIGPKSLVILCWVPQRGRKDGLVRRTKCESKIVAFLLQQEVKGEFQSYLLADEIECLHCGVHPRCPGVSRRSLTCDRFKLRQVPFSRAVGTLNAKRRIAKPSKRCSEILRDGDLFLRKMQRWGQNKACIKGGKDRKIAGEGKRAKRFQVLFPKLVKAIKASRLDLRRQEVAKGDRWDIATRRKCESVAERLNFGWHGPWGMLQRSISVKKGSQVTFFRDVERKKIEGKGRAFLEGERDVWPARPLKLGCSGDSRQNQWLYSAMNQGGEVGVAFLPEEVGTGEGRAGERRKERREGGREEGKRRKKRRKEGKGRKEGRKEKEGKKGRKEREGRKEEGRKEGKKEKEGRKEGKKERKRRKEKEGTKEREGRKKEGRKKEGKKKKEGRKEGKRRKEEGRKEREGRKEEGKKERKRRKEGKRRKEEGMREGKKEKEEEEEGKRRKEREGGRKEKEGRTDREGRREGTVQLSGFQSINQNTAGREPWRSSSPTPCSSRGPYTISEAARSLLKNLQCWSTHDFWWQAVPLVNGPHSQEVSP
ncbi:Axoneme-associated protein, partial [Ophiophagus hannah]